MEIVMGLLIVGLVLALLWAVIDWGQVLRNYFANTPIKGRVYIQSGEDLIPRDAKRISISKAGEIYTYKWGGSKHQVLVPTDYPLEYVLGRRAIAVQDGKLVASRLSGKPQSKINERDIISVDERQAVVELVLALTGKGFPKWLWILIGVGGAVVVFMLLSNFGGGEAVPPGETPINPETGETFTNLILSSMGVV